jgi:hypothetical protein
LHNTWGDNCEKCNEYYIGDATGGTPYDCVPENPVNSSNYLIIILYVFLFSLKKFSL